MAASVADSSTADPEIGETKTTARTEPTSTIEIPFEDFTAALDHDKTILLSVGRIIFSAIYLGFFTSVLFSHIPTSRMYAEAYSLSSVLASSGGDAVTASSPMKFSYIGQLSDVFDWLNNSLVPSVFVTQDQNGFDLDSKDFARVGLFNKGLGGVIIEVYRRTESDCAPNTYLYDLYETCHQGSITRFSYILFFSLDATEASQALDEWKSEDNWINNATDRAVISVLTYNGELEGYVVTELTLTLDQGGFVTPTSLVRPTISIPYGSSSSYASDVLVWIWMTMSVVWAIFRVLEWRKKANRPSGREMVLRLFSLFSVEVVLSVFYVLWGTIVGLLNDPDFQDAIHNYADPFKADDVGETEGINALLDVMGDLKTIAHYTAALRAVGAVVTALLCLQILNRFRFHPQLNILTRTVASALKQFGAFFVVFIVIFMGFAIIGSMIFGDQAKEFSSLTNSMRSCINIIFGQFDLDCIEDIPFSVVFFWGYMIVVGIVLLNLMLAIVLDAYDQVSKESYKKASNLKLANRVISICYDVVCELCLALSARRTATSRGRIKSRELNEKLVRSKSTTQQVNESVLQAKFPDTSPAERHATLQYIQEGVEIVSASKKSENDEDEELKEMLENLFPGGKIEDFKNAFQQAEQSIVFVNVLKSKKE